MKKIISLLLAVSMVLSLFPMGIFAEEDTSGDKELETVTFRVKVKDLSTNTAIEGAKVVVNDDLIYYTDSDGLTPEITTVTDEYGSVILKISKYNYWLAYTRIYPESTNGINTTYLKRIVPADIETQNEIVIYEKDVKNIDVRLVDNLSRTISNSSFSFNFIFTVANPDIISISKVNKYDSVYYCKLEASEYKEGNNFTTITITEPNLNFSKTVNVTVLDDPNYPLVPTTIKANDVAIVEKRSVTINPIVLDQLGNPIDAELDYLIDNPDIVTVDSDGKVTAKDFVDGANTALLTITVKGTEISKTITVTVLDDPNYPLVPTTIQTDSDNISVIEKQSAKVNAVVLDQLGNPIDAELDYSIADTNVATVDSDGKITAGDFVKGANITELTIRVRGTSIMKTIIVIVLDDPNYPNYPLVPTTIKADDVAIVEKQSVTINPIVLDQFGNPIDAELDYFIADSNIATVDSDGKVTAKDFVEGANTTELTITVKGTSISKTITVTVLDYPNYLLVPISIQADSDNISVIEKQSAKVNAVALDQLGNPIDAELDYSIADTNVATVDSEGNVIANDYVEGGNSTTLTITIRGTSISKTVNITVLDDPNYPEIPNQDSGNDNDNTEEQTPPDQGNQNPNPIIEEPEPDPDPVPQPQPEPTPIPQPENNPRHTTHSETQKSTSVIVNAYEKYIEKELEKKGQVVIEQAGDYTDYKFILPAKYFENTENIFSFIIKTDFCEIVIPNNIISSSDTNYIVVNITKGILDNKPIVKVEIKTDDKPVKNLNKKIKIIIDYIPEKNEDINKIIIVDENNEVIKNCKYNEETKQIEFYTNNSSQEYKVVYNNVTFADIKNHKQKNEIERLAARGIIEKTKDNEMFNPNENITRAGFVKLLVKMFDLKADVKSNFDDTEDPDIGIMKELGIVKGVGNNKFEPDRYITIEEVMVLIDRVLSFNNVEEMKTVDLNNFIDKNDVSAYAVESVKKVLGEGIMPVNNKRIRPKSNLTKAQAASILNTILNKYIVVK